MSIDKVTSQALAPNTAQANLGYTPANSANSSFTGDSITIPAGTTAQRPASPVAGMIRYNTTLGLVEQYNATGWQGIDAPPVITNFSGIINTDTDSVITVNGSNFKAGCVVYIEGNGVNNVSRSLTTTFVSSSQVTAQTNASSTNYIGGGSFNIKVTNPSGLSSTLSPAGAIDRDPIWSTSAGTVATINDRHGNYSPITTLSASDPDGTPITYSITSGAIPTNSSLNTSSGQITGSPGDVSGTTTYSFTVTASSDNQSTPRAFNIIVNPALDGSSSSRAASNATNIKTLTGTTTNGVYWLNLPIVGVTQVYCDMTTDGGGWMMFAYAGSTSGVGDSNHMIYNTIGSLATTRSYEQTSFSRFDIARAMSGASSSSLLMWRRTNDSNKILIHSANEMWNRMPGGSSAGNRDMNGSGSGYPISTMKMSRTGPSGIVTKTNGRYENGPSYPGIAWNSSYNDNTDNVGSFDTYLNRRQIAYWETNGPQSQSQWFHGTVLSLGDGSGPTGSQNRKDVEIYFKI